MQVASAMHGADDLDAAVPDPVKKGVGAADEVTQSGADIVPRRADLQSVCQTVCGLLQPVKHTVSGLRVVFGDLRPCRDQVLAGSPREIHLHEKAQEAVWRLRASCRISAMVVPGSQGPLITPSSHN